MERIIYCIIVLLLVGGVGMYIANKQADEKTRRERWLKYATYILITLTVLISIWFNLYYVIALITLSIGTYEIINVSLHSALTAYQRTIEFFIFAIIAVTFLLFSLITAKEWLLFIYLQVIVFDAFCQIVGQLIGKTKLAPNISEGKTWEGLIGGIAFCMIISLVLAPLINTTVGTAAILGVITSISSFVGDMLGSYYKRLTGVKDFSKILPAQGGFIDRFGSFMMTGTFYYILHYFAFSFT